MRSARRSAGSEKKRLDEPLKRPACSVIAATIRGWQWPGVVNRKARKEVEILLPVGVPEPFALAAHELDGRTRIGRHREAALERLKLPEVRHRPKPTKRCPMSACRSSFPFSVRGSFA